MSSLSASHLLKSLTSSLYCRASSLLSLASSSACFFWTAMISASFHAFSAAAASLPAASAEARAALAEAHALLADL